MKESMKEIMARLKPNIEVAQTAEDFNEIAIEILNSLDGGGETINKIDTAASFGLIALSLWLMKNKNKKLEPASLSFEEKDNDIVVVKVSGDLGSVGVRTLTAKMNDLIAEDHEKFILDIYQVEFVNITALTNAVMDLNNRVRVIIVGPRFSIKTIEEAMRALCIPR